MVVTGNVDDTEMLNMDTKPLGVQEILAGVISLVCLASIIGLINLIRIDLHEGATKVPSYEDMRKIAENDLHTLQSSMVSLVAKISSLASLKEVLTAQIESTSVMIKEKYPSVPLTPKTFLDRTYADYKIKKPLRDIAEAALNDMKTRLTGIGGEKEVAQQELDRINKDLSDSIEKLRHLDLSKGMQVQNWLRGNCRPIRPWFHGSLALILLGVFVRLSFRLALMRGWIKPNKV